RAGVVVDSSRRPRGFEHLVGRAAEQDRVGCSGSGGDRLPHLRVEPVIERPRRRVDHGVETHELVYYDISQCRLLVAVSTGSLRIPPELIAPAHPRRATTRSLVVHLAWLPSACVVAVGSARVEPRPEQTARVLRTGGAGAARTRAVWVFRRVRCRR